MLDEMTINDKINVIADHYGFEKQSRQLSEECAEVIQAVNKYFRYKEALKAPDDEILGTTDICLLIQNIAEEIADCEIMLQQMKHLLNINYGAIEAIKEIKVNRQIDRIEQEV